MPFRAKDFESGDLSFFLKKKYIDVNFASCTSNNPSIKWSSLLKQRTVSHVQATLPYQQTYAYKKCIFSVLMVSIRMIGQVKFRIKYFVMKATPFTVAWGPKEKWPADAYVRNLQFHSHIKAVFQLRQIPLQLWKWIRGEHGSPSITLKQIKSATSGRKIFQLDLLSYLQYIFLSAQHQFC